MWQFQIYNKIKVSKQTLQSAWYSFWRRFTQALSAIRYNLSQNDATTISLSLTLRLLLCLNLSFQTTLCKNSWKSKPAMRRTKNEERNRIFCKLRPAEYIKTKAQERMTASKKFGQKMLKWTCGGGNMHQYLGATFSLYCISSLNAIRKLGNNNLPKLDSD